MAPLFDYKAFDSGGKPMKGIVEAENVKAARIKIKKQGLMVTAISEKSASRPQGGSSIPFFGGRISAAEISTMTRQLASLVKANIPLVEALTALVEQTGNERLKVILEQVRQDVNEGSSLAKATGKHPKVFDNISVNMIEAGESSGTISLVLIKLADLRESQMRIRGKVIGGMTYPAIMMGVSLLLLVAIFAFVIPKISAVFDSLNKPLPPLTKFMIGVSGIVVDWWFIIFGVIGFVAWSFVRWTGSAKGRPKWDRIKLGLPVFGQMFRLLAITRFASTMSTLLGSGVPIIAAMNIAKNLVDNIPIANAIMQARENITEGQSIAEPLKRSGEFPPMMIHMISIGEKTGELPEMLNNVAETYESQVSSQVEVMTTLIEPGMIVFMGGTIAFIIFSVFMPLIDMTNINMK